MSAIPDSTVAIYGPSVGEIDMGRLRIDLSRIGLAQCSVRRAAAVLDEDQPALLVTDPSDSALLAWAYMKAPQHTAKVLVTSVGAFSDWLATKQTAVAQVEATTEGNVEAQVGHSSEELSLVGIGAERSAIVRFVSSVLFDALKAGASDVHLEMNAGGLAAKFRLDGVLVPVTRLDGSQAAAKVVSRIKVMSQLDIAEHRVPQDGRLSVSYRGRPIDVRVSVMPSIHGEDIVMRILDRQHLAATFEGLTLSRLGFDADTVGRLKRLCSLPNGMVLVTGPTGSGKTTTLYAALSETRDPREKIITIEDPVEYQLDGILQIPVNEKKGLTFAKGLRSILRHDPDRILVGEIRDRETAQIAVQSALTGHLVYTTVHANNAFDILSRFSQLGVDAGDLAAALNGVLAQRLLRTLCPDCAFTENGVARAVGCVRCRHTGYLGRTAIAELLTVSPDLRALLAQRADGNALRSCARSRGLVTMREQALRLVAHGVTTLEEADRVTMTQ